MLSSLTMACCLALAIWAGKAAARHAALHAQTAQADNSIDAATSAISR
jgi:hypothetical protein